MGSKTRKCVVCGTEFEFCPRSCKGAKQRWRFIYCGDNCHRIFDTITNVYDLQGVEVASDQLLDCDLSHIDNFRDDVKNKIYRIFDEADVSFKDKSVANTDACENNSKTEETMKTVDHEGESVSFEDDDIYFMSDSVDE